MHDAQYVLPRRAVDRGVMELHEDRESAFRDPRDMLEALDDVRHPQRPGMIQLPRLQPRDLGHELPPVTGFRQRDVAHVILEIEIAVFGPVGVVEREGHLHQLLPEQVNPLEALLERREYLLEAHGAGRCGGRVVDLQAADLQRRAVVFGEEEE
jgi:hypothetical protein